MRVTIFAIVLASMLMLNVSARAQEIVSENQIVAGARALGMGGAQIAAANDVTAVIHNPAALARIDKFEFQIGLDMLRKKIDTNLTGNNAYGSGSANSDYSGLGTFGLAYPLKTDRGSLVFALAYNRVKDFSRIFKNSYYDDYAFETDEEIWGGDVKNELNEEGGLGVVSLGGAVDVSPNVSLGLSLDIWTGSFKTDKRILRNDTPGKVSWLDITGGEDDITAVSVKPSVLYFKDNFRFGAFFRLPMTFHIDQKNYEEYYSRNDGNFFTIHQNIDPNSGSDFLDDEYYYDVGYKIKAPMQLGFGLSLGEPGKRCVAVDMVYENWKEAEIEDEYDPFYFKDKYRPSINWRIGLEHRLPVFNTIGRIGYIRQPVIFKGPRLDSPGEPEIVVVNEGDYLTFGFSKIFDESFSMDLGYAYGFKSVKEGNRKDKEYHNRLYAAVNYRLPEKYGK